MPIISVDTKKRELVGNFKNPGVRWGSAAKLVNDHDFRSDAIGIAILHGVYDILANHGHVTIGVSRDTAAFAVASIARWWTEHSASTQSGSREMLLLGDTGGSNGYRHRAVKTELQNQIADAFNIKVTVAHYPTGASKWNPIEHRLFSEISKNWAGEPLDSYAKILRFIRSTKTKTGLSASALPRPSQISHRRHSNSSASRRTFHQDRRNTAEVELHHIAALNATVHLFLRRP